MQNTTLIDGTRYACLELMSIQERLAGLEGGAVMRVLDIDLDFFLDNLATFRSDHGDRLRDEEYHPWPSSEVRTFLRQQCGLSCKHRIPGRVIAHHHEAFLFWRELIESERLATPFEVVHIDAHADLGMGTREYMYVLTHLLNRPTSDRWHPEQNMECSEFSAGNYLIFAIACRWISSLVYVTHSDPRCGRDDIPDHYMKDWNRASGVIQLRAYPPGVTMEDLFSERVKPLSFEQEVPLTCISGRSYHSTGPFDFTCLSQSHGFTPASSDELMNTIREYMAEG